MSAPLALLFILADLGALGRLSLPALAVRLVWAGVLAGAALLLPKVSGLAEQALMTTVAVVSSLCFAALVVLTGGHSSPMFHWILASPLTIAVVVQDQPRATLAAGVTTVASGLAILANDGQPAAVMLPWGIQAAGMSAVAVYASSVYRRLRDRERTANLARIADLERQRALDAANAARDRAEAAVRARDAFLAVASHELRTPLTSLTLEVQGLLNRTSETSRDRERLQTVERQSERLNALVDRLMDVSRINTQKLALELERADLSATVAEHVERWRPVLTQAQTPLTTELTPGLSGIVDRLRLGQIVDNLLSNALKYGAGRPVRVELRGEGDWAVLSVKDRGIGVPALDQERIFERFERGLEAQKQSGLGLGLYITREIARALGGEIRLRSVEGEGTCFTLRLPLAGPRPLGQPSEAVQ